MDPLQDILQALRIPHALVLKRSFDRPNLKYEVIGKTKATLKQLSELLMDRFNNQCGIIYCLSRSECVEVSNYLNEKCKIKTVHYHAGLAAHQRVSAQKKWYTGEAQVACATIAFGMGIDKPDVVCPYKTILLLLVFYTWPTLLLFGIEILSDFNWLLPHQCPAICHPQYNVKSNRKLLPRIWEGWEGQPSCSMHPPIPKEGF